jgi:hypothetical protein
VTAATVDFLLSDGTRLTVCDADMRGVYEALWDISDHTGAISTAALLIDEGRKRDHYRLPIRLNLAQSNALVEAAAHFAKPSS